MRCYGLYKNATNILTQVQKAFYNLTMAFAFHGLSLRSEVIDPIMKEKQGRFSVTTPFNLEAGVKGQIQHLENIPRP